MHSLLTVFLVEHKEEFLRAIERPEPPARPQPVTRTVAHRVVLEELLQLPLPVFEQLVAHLLEALGFEDCQLSEHQAPGQDVVDACGEIRLALPARIRVHARFHRGNLGARIGAEAVRQLRQLIPFGGHGVYVTTADFEPAAAAAAMEEGFARISLVSGDQLADLIAQQWTHLPVELRDRLSLEQALVKG
ncbi:restriction endonuclease [Synechococcus sp. CCY 9618]|uniref:restriction endonuclease n=1 Tax=Synechococcus sp. CCY 9618 TaxID=2815602 RepID=UPI001C229257|nr:restriction endonuclease [Synechococcus sp. CCY 9618]